jgi:hypothetical protein
MDNESLTVYGLLMGGRILGDRQDLIIGRKYHGRALVILSLRRFWFCPRQKH